MPYISGFTRGSHCHAISVNLSPPEVRWRPLNFSDRGATSRNFFSSQTMKSGWRAQCQNSSYDLEPWLQYLDLIQHFK
ncbi:hypothetical protein LguiB_024604 [Lonicera macranthoides]